MLGGRPALGKVSVMQQVRTDSHVSAPAGLSCLQTRPRYKRPFDLLGGVLLLLLMAPVAAVVAVLIKLSSSGPVLFRQERIGQDGRPFVMYKFRTMHHGVDSSLHRAYFTQYQQGKAAPGQTSTVFKLQRDPRITPLGGILRRLGLDEIPQLFNVIKGEMSLVGPRPPLRYEVERYSERDRLRLSVKPGLTGLWQIKGRDVVDFATMIDLDLEYIRRQALSLDVAILLATAPALIWASIRR
jgi:lipopolysaccharide/colanic/teichoic acid biosynthesis glycosyltransferase